MLVNAGNGKKSQHDQNARHEEQPIGITMAAAEGTTNHNSNIGIHATAAEGGLQHNNNRSVTRSAAHAPPSTAVSFDVKGVSPLLTALSVSGTAMPHDTATVLLA